MSTIPMKNFINKFSTSQKIEFWAASSLFIFTLIEISEYFQWHQLIEVSTLYLVFLLLNFYVVPNLLSQKELLLNLILLSAGLVVLWRVFSYLENAVLIYFLIGLYTLVKIGINAGRKNKDTLKSTFSFASSGTFIAFFIWLILMFLLFAGNADEIMTVSMGILIPVGILLYHFSIHNLIPGALRRKRPFLVFFTKVSLILIIAAAPVALLCQIFTDDEDVATAMVFFNGLLHLTVTMPLSWYIYKRQMKGREELFTLKKELGQSTASFDFLRSQINPHFLFNALNTLYGTSIQEKADRTGEGIQKLGDMMRFMLHENMQEKISLARELEYLNNYISLQRLRTDTHPNVNIIVEIGDAVDQVQIAPMLLIPFVENAFKHGISFREPSHMKIALKMDDGTLFFDVYNSMHEKKETDPEKNKSGIGLINVKQRLKLLYPNKHELVIRETGKEFFVHLTIQLS